MHTYLRPDHVAHDLGYEHDALDLLATVLSKMRACWHDAHDLVDLLVRGCVRLWDLGYVHGHRAAAGACTSPTTVRDMHSDDAAGGHSLEGGELDSRALRNMMAGTCH